MSQFEIDIRLDVPVDESLVDLLRAAATVALFHERAKPHSALAILLTGDERIQDLNRDFMGHDSPTDVLSFPAGNKMPGAETYVGDIAVSMSAAERQAAEAGHTLADELQLLVVHAVLHLLGYDHSDAIEKATMWSVQAAVLERLGVQMAYAVK